MTSGKREIEGRGEVIQINSKRVCVGVGSSFYLRDASVEAFFSVDRRALGDCFRYCDVIERLLFVFFDKILKMKLFFCFVLSFSVESDCVADFLYRQSAVPVALC